MRSEKLFELLDDSGASTLTLMPRDADGKAMGVIVVVREDMTQEFLAMLEEWNQRSVPTDNYGWDDV
jgi:hypothetical protein